MEPWSLLISWVNPFPSRFINSPIFFCNALESHECTCCLLFDERQYHFHFSICIGSFLCQRAKPPHAGKRSIYKSTRERVDSKGLDGTGSLHLMGSWGDHRKNRAKKKKKTKTYHWTPLYFSLRSSTWLNPVLALLDWWFQTGSAYIITRWTVQDELYNYKMNCIFSAFLGQLLKLIPASMPMALRMSGLPFTLED